MTPGEGAGAVVAGGLLGVAASQAAGLSDRVPPLTGAAMLTPVAHLPQWAVLAGALATRRHRLAAVAAAGCVAHLALLRPALRPAQPPPPALGPDTRTVTMATNNGLYDNANGAAWAAALLALDPDVLGVQELSSRVHAALVDAGVEERYPHAEVHVRELSEGTGTWSRHPVIERSTVLLGTGRSDEGLVGNVGVVTRLDVDGTELTHVNVHTVAPIDRPRRAAWHAGFAALRGVLDGVSGPVVLMGDWNATTFHAPLRRFLAAEGLRCAHGERGRGLAATWPAPGAFTDVRRRVVRPVALLDRVLVRGPVAVEHVVEHLLPGTDHAAVGVRLCVGS